MNYKDLRENTLLGYGLPLLDLIVRVDDDYLMKHKLRKNKTVPATEEHNELFKDIIENQNPTYVVGGCVHNALYVMQWIIEKPNVATFLGCVGDDEYADIVEKAALEVGINVQFEKLQTEATSSCAVLVTDKDRTLVTRIRTLNRFSEEYLKNIWHYVEKSQFFYIMGFSLSTDFIFTMKVAKHSNENCKKFIMNLSAEYICKKYIKEFVEIFPYIDIIIGNELELLAFAAALDIKECNANSMCLEIANLPKINNKLKRICIITRNKKPLIFAKGNEVKEYPAILVSQEEIVDSNGAGDAFVGGFLAQLVAGRNLEECIKCGQWAASISLRHIGCKMDDESKNK